MRYLALATLAAATATLVATPVFAQTVEELTVTGHAQKNARQTLSRAVSFADLDLTRPNDRKMLRMRIVDTAGDICQALNEPAPGPANLGRSCQDIAVRDAMVDVRVAVAAARGAAYADAAFAEGWSTPAAQAYGEAASADASYAAPAATFTTNTVTNGPVADTPENRARYGGPMSHAGKRTSARGN